MNPEIHASELQQETATGPATPCQNPGARKSLVEVCDPIRGLTDDMDFSRNQSIARPVDL